MNGLYHFTAWGEGIRNQTVNYFTIWGEGIQRQKQKQNIFYW